MSAPAITNQPQGQTVMSGSNLVFSVGASGSGPVRYFWRFNNSFLPNQTNSSLSLSNVGISQGGSYTVIVSNFVGSVTSAPALLRVKRVEWFVGSQLLTNGSYTFASPPTMTLRSVFTNGASFYTLDGSAPTFNSLRTPVRLP